MPLQTINDDQQPSVLLSTIVYHPQDKGGVSTILRANFPGGRLRRILGREDDSTMLLQVTVRPGTFTFIDASDMLLLIDRTPGIVNSNSQLGRIVAQHNEARADQMIGWLFATLRPGVKSSAVAAQMSGVQFAGGTDVLEVIELFTAVPQVVMVLSFGTLAAAFAARDLVSSALKDHVSVERICY